MLVLVLPFLWKAPVSTNRQSKVLGEYLLLLMGSVYVDWALIVSWNVLILSNWHAKYPQLVRSCMLWFHCWSLIQVHVNKCQNNNTRPTQGVVINIDVLSEIEGSVGKQFHHAAERGRGVYAWGHYGKYRRKAGNSLPSLSPRTLLRSLGTTTLSI